MTQKNLETKMKYTPVHTSTTPIELTSENEYLSENIENSFIYGSVHSPGTPPPERNFEEPKNHKLYKHKNDELYNTFPCDPTGCGYGPL